jgi:hypothetical protein
MNNVAKIKKKEVEENNDKRHIYLEVCQTIKRFKMKVDFDLKVVFVGLTVSLCLEDLKSEVYFLNHCWI